MTTKQRAGEDERTGVQSAETGLRVLTAFIGAEPMPMLKTVAERAGMHPAKVHRYLVSLCRFGYVQQDADSGRYRLGEGALQLGYAAMNSIDVLGVARPILQELSHSHRHSAALALWGPGGATVAFQALHPAPITLSARLGSVLPMLTSSTGRTFGAWLPRGATQSFVREELLAFRKHPVARCPTSLDEVDALFDEVRRRGLERVTGQLNPAVCAMSAPVLDGVGQIAAVVSMLGPLGQFDTHWNGSIAKALRASAAAMSKSLGWSKSPPESRVD